MSEGLKPRRARGGAFSVDRTDLDDVMTPAPPQPKPLSELLPKVAPASTASTPKPKVAAPATTGERARGVGGRPPRAVTEDPQHETRGVSKRAARIPADVYAAAEALVKGPGKPSWGQLIYWACTTHRDAVLAQVMQRLAPPDPMAPRGPNRAGGVTTPIVPQFLGAEIDPFDEIQAAAHAQAVSSASRPVKVTATAVVIAALRVAVDKSPTQDQS